MSESDLIKRDALAELLPSDDGRTLEVRIIPYSTVTRVSDNGRDFYDEEWSPGAFERQLAAPNRVDVLANFEHQQGIQGAVARGTELRDTNSALEGTFRMLNHPDADKALELVNEGVLTGVSIEAIPLKTERIDGVVKRVKARLVNIALCRSPAFADAQVLAVREAVEEPPEEPAEPEEPPAEGEPQHVSIEPAGTSDRSAVDAILERVGFEPLLTRAVVKTPWDGSPARFSDEEYQRSCLIDRGGDASPKTRCSLPVLEPNGDVNVNALGQAAGRLNQVSGITSAQRSAAARKLMRYYGMASIQPPPSVRAAAGR